MAPAPRQLRQRSKFRIPPFLGIGCWLFDVGCWPDEPSAQVLLSQRCAKLFQPIRPVYTSPGSNFGLWPESVFIPCKSGAKLPAKNKNYQTNPFVIFRFADEFSTFPPLPPPIGKKRTQPSEASFSIPAGTRAFAKIPPSMFGVGSSMFDVPRLSGQIPVLPLVTVK